MIQRHGEYYAEAEGFDSSFEALVARILSEFVASHDPAEERGWIAETPWGRRLGCIFCVRDDAETARLRLFFLEPDARGQKLGLRLLHACMEFARGVGYRRMVLWTHKSHEAACALYAANGFSCTRETPVHHFGHDLVEQNWEIEL
nr:GNAT family N-acetyltransferase [Aliiruegeria haliotis]